jgi:hypothetical protein
MHLPSVNRPIVTSPKKGAKRLKREVDWLTEQFPSGNVRDLVQSQARAFLPEANVSQLVSGGKLYRNIYFPVFADEAIGRLFTNLDFVCVCVIPAGPDRTVVDFMRMKIPLNIGSVRPDVQVTLERCHGCMVGGFPAGLDDLRTYEES